MVFELLAMADVQNERESLKVSEKPALTGDLKYHYSPVPSNCMACAARTTSRKHKELELQKSEAATICTPFPSRDHLRNCCDPITKEKYRRTELRVVTTNQRIKVFGKWSEQKLLTVVTDRLLQRASSAAPQRYEDIQSLKMKPVSPGIPYDPIIHRGIYSESILGKLYFSGASESVLIRAMKFGLRHLESEDLNYFLQFGVLIPVLRSRKLWKEVVDESLTTSLRTMGFDEKSSRKIILTGILSQNENTLMQLMLAGVDIPSILNWQGATIDIGPRLIQFLRKLRVPEDVMQLVVQKGIDEETYEMLRDLGFTETEAEEHPGMHEVVVCECSLTILESQAASLVSRSVDNNSSKSNPKISDNQADMEAEETCGCSLSTDSSTLPTSSSSVYCDDVSKSLESSSKSSEILDDRNHYLRRTVMIPLSWAMAKALQYRPTDPKYYIACQLVRWRHGGVSETEMKKVEDFVTSRSIAMDKKLMEEKLKEEEELRAELEAEVLKNIPCHPCWERQQIHRVKQRCWKCITKWVPNYEPCEFQEICSSCNVDLSHILNSDSSTTSGATISNIPSVMKSEDKKETFKDREGFVSSNENCYTEEMESSSFHRDYNTYEELLGSGFSAENGSGVSNDSNRSKDSGNLSPTV